MNTGVIHGNTVGIVYVLMKMHIRHKESNCNTQHKIGQAQIDVSVIIGVHNSECT
jgi:hypothetical protein